MRTISANLEAHYGQECTTLAKLWKVTRTDGQVFGFTNHDKNLTVPPISGVVYNANTGFSASAVRSSLGLSVDNLEVAGGLDSAAITEADLRAGIWDFATVEVMEVNWASVVDGVQTLSKGKTGQVRTARGAFVVELLGIAKILSQAVGRSILPACDANLGDSRCSPNGEVSLSGSPSNSFFTAFTVTTVNSKRVFRAAALTAADGWYDYGQVDWATGLNAGLSMEVKTSVLGSPADTIVSLMLPMPYTIQIGDTGTIKAGCDKRSATCISKFANIVNFRGDPFVPGPDEILQYPDAH